MAQSKLRIHCVPDQTTPDHDVTVRQPVHLRLGEVFPLLVDAVRGDRAWLRDFQDDEISISADLYDVLAAYQHFHRSSTA